MSGRASRAGVALATLVACAGSLALLLHGGGLPVGAPAEEELEKIEAGTAASARLHPAPAEIAPGGAASFCRGCHPLPAHPGTRVADAMRNAHAAWMDCLGCHWSEANGKRPAPRWLTGPGQAALAAVLPPERSTAEELGRLRAAVTARRVCFERGPECGGCHRPGGIAAWGRPGGSPARAAQLERLDTVFTLAPGEKWYFPQFQ